MKWDGYRALAYIRGSEVQLLSRRDNDLTERFANVAKEVAKAVKTPHAVIDGEVCALDERGRASFSAMQQGGTALVYYVFDVLEVEGVPLVDLPLRERRERLEKLLDRRNRCVRLSETFDDGDALYEAAQQQELEGIMAKRLDSRYCGGPAHARLAEDQDARPAGVHHRRLHARRRPARVDVRLADPRRPRRRRAALRRQRRHRLQRRRDPPAPLEAQAVASRDESVSANSQAASRAEG